MWCISIVFGNVSRFLFQHVHLREQSPMAQGSRFRRTMGPFRSSCPGLVGALGDPISSQDGIGHEWFILFSCVSWCMIFIIYCMYCMQIFVYDMEWTWMDHPYGRQHTFASCLLKIFTFFPAKAVPNVTAQHHRESVKNLVFSTRFCNTRWRQLKYVFHVHRENWGKWFSFWLIIFRCVGSTTN